MKTVAIVNPVAGLHLAPRRWPHFLASQKTAASEIITWWTKGPGHAETLAARARREGFERVLAVGGDGTLLEVVNGLWWESHGMLPSLGTVPFGTGCDYVRNFAQSTSLSGCLTIALGETTVPISVGRVRLQSLDGRQYQRIFVNVLGLGLDAGVIARYRQRRLHLPGKLAYVRCVLQELWRLRHFSLKSVVDGQALNTEAVLMAIGLGRYFGGGMMITPGASIKSQRFQVVLAQRLSRLALLGLVPKVYSGNHLDHPRLLACHGRDIEVITDPPALVEAEGELIGRAPLKVKIVPEALQFAGQPLETV